MKINELRDFSKDDVLSALGLTSKPSTSDRLLGALSIFGVGLLVGAGAALLLAPKTGQALRADLGERFRNLRPEETESLDTAPASGEART
jgi:gas vesicle protein